MKKISIILTISLFLFSKTELMAQSQKSELLNKYRVMALDYNYDLKAAQKNIEASLELEKMTRADRKPQLGGGASFQYVGNPTSLSLSLPNLDKPIAFEGQNISYGATVSILQPVYTGGRVLENIKLAQLRNTMASDQADIVRNSVCFQLDMQYWSTVARLESVGVMSDFKNSIDSLVSVIKDRVDVGVIDPQDLLMAEVKLNEAEYMLLQAKSNFETGQMALNSIIGVNLDDNTDVDNSVPMPCSLNEIMAYQDGVRGEIRLAENNVSVFKSTAKLEDSKFKPQLYVGADGSYSSPGYNFKSDLDPNYAVYAKLSIPIFEWGKRRSNKTASKLKIGIADDQLNRIKDQVSLEVESAKKSYIRAIDRVRLTENSLSKAAENERRAIERYAEGRISIVEVIDAQVYRQNSQMNFIQAKVEAQAYHAELLRAINGYSKLK